MAHTIEWAERETNLGAAENGQKEYYEAVFNAYCFVKHEFDTLEFPGVAKTLLRQLLEGEPLTPIENVDENWFVISGFDPAANGDNPGFTVYQSNRRGSLYKHVKYDRKTGEVDEVSFTDTDRSVCIDIETEEIYTSTFANGILDEMVPIKMPYYPKGKIKIFVDEFRAYPESKENDTIAILHFRFEDGRMQEVMRFFKVDPVADEVVEIDKQEYIYRKKKSQNKKEE